MLDLAALRVEHVELERELVGGLPVLCRQQCDARPRRLDAPGRVESRREQEAQMACRDLLVLEARDLDERCDARQRSRLHAGHALLDDAAVLPAQRHDVCHRAECYELEVIEKDRLTVPLCAPALRIESLAELESHADTGEILVGIRAVRAVRVEHCTGGRQRTAWQMMVRDDDVDVARPLYRCDIRDRRDAAVDRDQEVRVLGNRLERPRPNLAQRSRQERCRRHAVDVVVAVDRNVLALLQSAHDARDSLVHVAHLEGIAKRQLLRMQEELCLFARADAAVPQKSRHRRVPADLACKRLKLWHRLIQFPLLIQLLSLFISRIYLRDLRCLYYIIVYNVSLYHTGKAKT